MVWFLHLANVLILCSFLVRDILLLRVLSIVAGVAFCIYFYANNMFEPIAWNILFSIVNIAQIGIMWFQRRKIPLTPIEQQIYDQFFPSLQPREIRALLDIADVQDSSAPTFSGLGLVLKGRIEVNQKVFTQGSFVGIRSFLTKKEKKLQGKALCPCNYICWRNDNLRDWASKTTDRHNLLLRALSTDLLQKSDAN